MKTNREKYEHYRTSVVERDAAVIASLLPAGVPNHFYTILNYEAVPVEVTHVDVWRRGLYAHDEGDKVTKVEVAHAQKCADEWVAPTLESIHVHYKDRRGYGTVTGAHLYSTIESDPMMAWTADALAPEIERRRALYAPREGCKPCQYCRKQHPENELVSAKIFYRDRGGLQTKIGQYCSGQCAGYDQCGHEG